MLFTSALLLLLSTSIDWVWDEQTYIFYFLSVNYSGGYRHKFERVRHRRIGKYVFSCKTMFDLHFFSHPPSSFIWFDFIYPHADEMINF